MLPAFLITFREAIEATLIVATILGILVKINQRSSFKTVWLATGSAFALILALLGISSIIGVKFQTLYTGKIEQMTEGVLLMTSALFITFAVFFLHKYFSSYKVQLLQKVKSTVESHEQKSLFMLVFTAVFREGIEIVLFLSTIYFSSSPSQIFTGFSGGIVAGLLVSFALFSATVRLPLFYAFKTTSILLIFFAAGLLAKGAHELTEFGLIPQTQNLTFSFLPSHKSILGNMINAIFGLNQQMDSVQLLFYFSYIFIMVWYVFFRKQLRNTVAIDK